MDSQSVDWVLQALAASLEEATGLEAQEIVDLITTPPDEALGDFALPCFVLSRRMRRDPASIAREIAAAQAANPLVAQANAAGPYVNLHLDRVWLGGRVLRQALGSDPLAASKGVGEGQRVLIEFSSPNVAKEFGVGHLRSTIIGSSLARLHMAHGFDVVRLNYLGDWGTQFGKLIEGYRRFGDDERLRTEPIAHLTDIYVRMNQESTESDEALFRETFRRLEQGEPEVVALWERFRELSLAEFDKVYRKLGVSFDFVDAESRHIEGAQRALQALEERGLLVTSRGARGVDLSAQDLGFAIMEKSDGATIYGSRDVAAAIDRHEQFGFDRMIYEVGAEQALHFQQLFAVLALMGHDWAGGLEHVEHGLYLGADGKKLSTRRGTSPRFDDLWNEVAEQVQAVYREKNARELEEEIATHITRAAIVYADLKSFRGQNIVFDPATIVSLQGNTGPYLQYTGVRARAILDQAPEGAEAGDLDQEPEEMEYRLLLRMSRFPAEAYRALQSRDPSLIAAYAFALAKDFNQMYTTSQVLGSPREAYRLALVRGFVNTLEQALWLVGIDIPARM